MMELPKQAETMGIADVDISDETGNKGAAVARKNVAHEEISVNS